MLYLGNHCNTSLHPQRNSQRDQRHREEQQPCEQLVLGLSPYGRRSGNRSVIRGDKLPVDRVPLQCLLRDWQTDCEPGELQEHTTEGSA